MKRQLAIALAFLMLSIIVPLSSMNDTEGVQTSDLFTNDGTVVSGGSVSLSEMGGVDTQYYFMVGKNVPISYAHFNISTQNSSIGSSMDDPFIDVGLDGKHEWEYDATGYGKFGEQTLFTDDAVDKRIEFPASGGSISDHAIYIPEGADVNEAALELFGRFRSVSRTSSNVEQDPSPLSMTLESMEEADIDNDGDTDIIVSDTRADRLYWFENPGNTSMKWPYHRIYTGSNSYLLRDVKSLDVGDIDEDGHIDVVCSSHYYTRIYYIRNNNNGTSWTLYQVQTGFTYAGKVKIADIDNDGNPDIVAYTWRAPSTSTYYDFLYWFKAASNPNRNYWTANKIADPPHRYLYTYYGMDVGDLDNDGDIDIAVSVYTYYTYYGTYERIYKYTNPGTFPGTWSRLTIDNNARQVHTLTIDNVTGDSSPEIVAGLYGSDDINIYNVTDNVTKWKERKISNFNNPRFTRVDDMDDDGNPDIIVGGGNSPYDFSVFYQDPTGGTFTKNTISNEILNPMAYSVLDIDDDGDKDFIVGGTSGSQLAQIECLNKTNKEFELFWLEDGGIKEIRAMDMMDMDNDGDTDVVFGAYASPFLGWAENDLINGDGNPLNGPGELHQIGKIGSTMQIQFGDVDGDGDKDLVTMRAGGTLDWWENEEDPFSLWTSHRITNSIPSAYEMVVGDITGDGKADVATSSAGGWSGNNFIRLYRAPANPASSSSWPYNVVASGMQYQKGLWADDLDLDGDLDIMGVHGSWGSGAAVHYKNPLPAGDPTVGRWQTKSIGGGMYYPKDIRTIDITDDGYPDVVVTSDYYYYSKAMWFQNPGRGSSWKGNTLYSGTGTHYIAVGDIGNDGFADIVINRGTGYNSNPSSIYWIEEEDWKNNKFNVIGLGSYSGTWDLEIEDLNGDDHGEIISTSRGSNQIRAYNVNPEYPNELEMDIGADENDYDWYRPGKLETATTTVDFKNALQEVIDNPSSVSRFTDNFGNTLLRIPLEIFSQDSGRLVMSDIKITYNATVYIDHNGEGDRLANVLDRLIPDKVDSDPNLRIYIGVGARTAGEAYISNLFVEYNAIPRQRMAIPDMEVFEDNTRIVDRIDLREYFTDDYTDPGDLEYSIYLSGPYGNKISASIDENFNVFLDSTITENFHTRPGWDSDIQAKIKVKDDGGPNNVPPREMFSKKFNIIVNPTNDPPVTTGEGLPLLQAVEGEVTTIVDLDDYDLFYDVDGDPLRYYLDPDLDHPSYDENARFKIDWLKKDNVIVVSLNEFSDWTGLVKVDMYASDLSDFNLTGDPVIEFMVNVSNINDGPRWTNITDVTVTEDVTKNKMIELSQFAVDMDTPRAELDIHLMSYTNKSFIKLWTERTVSNQMFVNFEPRTPNWNGMSTVYVSLSDGEYTVESSFNIIVDPVDDLPRVWISEPIENGRVDPGVFSIVGEAEDVEGIEYVEVLFEGEWFLAKGTNNWGKTLEAEGTDQIIELVPIQVRAFDGANFAYAYVNVTILPVEIIEDLDYDDDGYPNTVDAFPYDPSEWADSDRDGMGDNTDAFPFIPEWQYDSDKDGIADKADTHPFDPDLWDDKNDDNRNDFLPPIQKSTDTQEGSEYISVFIVLLIISILLALISITAFMMFISKRSASKDPRKMAKYYAKQQKSREWRHDLIEKLPLAKLMDKLDTDKLGGPAPAPGIPSHVGPSPVLSRPGLPARPGGSMQPALPGAVSRVPPPPLQQIQTRR